MNEDIILQPVKGEARVSSVVMAERLGIQHKNALELIDKHKSNFEELGRVAFQTRPFETNGGVQKQRIALLNPTFRTPYLVKNNLNYAKQLCSFGDKQ